MTVKEQRIKVWNKYDKHCSYCGKEIAFKEMQVDHGHPIYMSESLFKSFGIDVKAYDNLMPACRRCNHYKREKNIEDFRKAMLTIHERIQARYVNKVGIDFGVITLRPFDGIFYFEKQTNKL